MSTSWKLLLAMLACNPLVSNADALHDRLAKNGVAASTTWQTDAEDLLCVATRNEVGETNRLRCYSKSKADPVASFDIEPGLIQIQVLGLVGGPLVLSWGTGSGYAFSAYAYQSGKVKEVWSSGSFMPFETFWGDDQAESMVVALAEPSWVEIHGEKEKVAGTAQLFVWRDSKFIDLGTSAWKDRQQYAAARLRARAGK